MAYPVSRSVEFRILAQGCRGINRFTCARSPALQRSIVSENQINSRQGILAIGVFLLVALCAAYRGRPNNMGNCYSPNSVHNNPNCICPAQLENQPPIVSSFAEGD